MDLGILLFISISAVISKAQVIRSSLDASDPLNSIRSPSNEDVYSALVQVNIRCKNDPYNGLTCAAEYPDQCREKWNFPNPCTQNNMDMNIHRFVHPFDKTKFLMCGQLGKLYVVQCPQHEIFHDRCGECREPGDTAYCSGGGAQSGSMGSDGINVVRMGGTSRMGDSANSGRSTVGSMGGSRIMGGTGISGRGVISGRGDSRSMVGTGTTGRSDMGDLGASSRMGFTRNSDGSVSGSMVGSSRMGGAGNVDSNIIGGMSGSNSMGNGGTRNAEFGISINDIAGNGNIRSGGSIEGSGQNIGATPLQPLPFDICTRDAIIANRLFFPFPGNLSKFIHCDVWGKPWERVCTTGEVWSSLDVTCVLPHLLNPCNRPSTDINYLYTHPCDQTKYLACDTEGRAHEMNCAKEEAFNVTMQQCQPFSYFKDKILSNYCGNYNFGFKHSVGNAGSSVTTSHVDQIRGMDVLSQRNRDTGLFRGAGRGAINVTGHGSQRDSAGFIIDRVNSRTGTINQESVRLDRNSLSKMMGTNTNTVGNNDGTAAFERTTQIRGATGTRPDTKVNLELSMGLLNDGTFATSHDSSSAAGFNDGTASNLVDNRRKSLSNGPGTAEFVDIRNVGSMGISANLLEKTGNARTNSNNIVDKSGIGVSANDISGSILSQTDKIADRKNNGTLNISNDIAGSLLSNNVGNKKKNDIKVVGQSGSTAEINPKSIVDVRTQTVTSGGGIVSSVGHFTGFDTQVPETSNIGSRQSNEIISIGGQRTGKVNGRTLGLRSDSLRGSGTSNSGTDTVKMNNITLSDQFQGIQRGNIKDLVSSGNQHRLSDIASFDLRNQLGLDESIRKGNAIIADTSRSGSADINRNQINGKGSERDLLTSWDQIIGSERANIGRNSLIGNSHVQGGTPTDATETIHPSRLKTYAYSEIAFSEPCTQANIEAGRTHFKLEGFPHMFLQCDTSGKMHRMPCSGKDWFDVYTNTCVDGPIHVSNSAIKT